MPKVYIKLPKTGLGNMLFVWARGFVFATNNNFQYTTSSWWGWHWGALFRNENKKRFYFGFFNESGFFAKIFVKFHCLIYPVIKESEFKNFKKDNQKTIFIFNEVITNQDLFFSLRDHVDIISKGVYDLLLPNLKNQLLNYEPPLIGVHIRMGDFKLSNQSMPLSYFINLITIVRNSFNYNVPVTIFTDASISEMEPLFYLPNITFAEAKPDILDILLLSKSKILILSRSSTFSYWAAFLSDALVIRPGDDWQPLIKFPSKNSKYTEIKWLHDDFELSSKLSEQIINLL